LNLIVLGVSAQWILWKGKEVLDRQDSNLRREDLGHSDEAEWEPGLDGKPKDPWAYTPRVELLDPKTLDEYRFETSNKGGRACVDELVNKVNKVRTLHPGATPIVTLTTKIMKTKYGPRPRPSFKIVGWRFPKGGDPGTPVLPKPANDLDDAIPW
jgi:hypothetical protein